MTWPVSVPPQLFNKERKLYTRELLEQHKRHGDDGDDSYSGHPLCELCQQRSVTRVSSGQ